jgi:hypothetical protein
MGRLRWTFLGLVLCVIAVRGVGFKSFELLWVIARQTECSMLADADGDLVLNHAIYFLSHAQEYRSCTSCLPNLSYYSCYAASGMLLTLLPSWNSFRRNPWFQLNQNRILHLSELGTVVVSAT